MSLQTQPITAEQFMQLHFDVPVELVRGELSFPYGEDGMTRPDQVHGGVCSNINFAIRSWAQPRQAGRTSTNDSVIRTLRNPDTLRGADVSYFRMGQLPEGKLPAGRTDLIPSLCVEVLSPSNTYTEIAEKREEYLECGVEEVWIVDPETRTIDVFRTDAPQMRFHANDVLTSGVLPEFACPVIEVFDGI